MSRQQRAGEVGEPELRCYTRLISFSSVRPGVRRAPDAGEAKSLAALGRLAVSTSPQGQALAGGRGERGVLGIRAGAGSGSGDNFKSTLLTDAICAGDLLSIVKDNLSELDERNVSTALLKLAKMTAHQRGRSMSPQHLTADEAFQGLLQRARIFAHVGRIPAHTVAAMLRSMVKLYTDWHVDMADATVESTLAALVGAAVRMAPDLKPDDVGHILKAHAELGRMPEADTWEALETAAVRVAPRMAFRAATKFMWAYATLGRAPKAETLEALEAAIERSALDVTAKTVANSFYNLYAAEGRMPEINTWEALQTAAVRVAPVLTPPRVAKILMAHAILERLPEVDTWEALEYAVARVAPDMTPSWVATTLLAYAKLGRMPKAGMWEALASTVERVAPDMRPSSMTSTLWAYTTLSTLRDVKLSPSYAVVWELVCDMEARDFSPVHLQQLFHAYLVHQTFLSSQMTTITPAWLMVEARELWMRNVRVNCVSRAQRGLSRILGELDIAHEVEHVTDDGYFSIDIYLPDHDVAVEFDGPYH